MPLTHVPVQLLAQNNFFLSKASAQAANLGQLNARHIMVIENGEIVLYHPVEGAVNLVGADGSRWKCGSVGVADLIALAGELNALFTGIGTDSGAFLPALSWSGGGGSFAYGIRDGRWNQIHNRVFIDLTMSVTLVTLGAENLRLTGIAEGQRPVPGPFPGYLDVVSKSDSFFFPKESSDFRINWTGGSANGVFGYFSASGWASVFLSGLTGGLPVGNNGPVTWSGGAGGSGRMVDWQPSPSDPTQGRLVLHRIIGSDPSGVITDGIWTANASGLFGGARGGERFLNASNFSAGQTISFAASGSWRIA